MGRSKPRLERAIDSALAAYQSVVAGEGDLAALGRRLAALKKFRGGLLGVKEVAALSGLSVATVYTYRSRGTLPEADLVVGNTPLWFRPTIDRWIARSKR